MSATSKATRDIPVEECANTGEFVDSVAALYKNGVERMAELQSRSIDCAVQHNKETMKLWKQMTEKLPWAPRLNMFEEAAGTLERLAESQKAVINLVVEQNRVFVEMVKDRSAAANKTTGSIVKFAQQSFERSVAAQKKAATATVAETKSAFDNAREQFGFPGGEAVAESIQHGVGTMIDAQKELLEAASSRWAEVAETVTAP